MLPRCPLTSYITDSGLSSSDFILCTYFVGISTSEQLNCQPYQICSCYTRATFCAPFMLHIMFAIVIRDLPDSLDGVDGEPDVGLRPVASGALGNEPSRGNKATGLS